MGFNSVYKSLQEIFPQVDSRLLRAVAIEHPKDADVAAGIVLTEVIPLMSQSIRSPPATPPQYKGPGMPSNLEVESEIGNRLRPRRFVAVEDVGSSSAPQSIWVDTIKTADCSSAPDLNVTLDELPLSNVNNSNDFTYTVSGMNEIKDLNVFYNAEDNFSEETSNKIVQDMSNSLIQEASENLDQGQVHVDVDSANLISSGLCQQMEPEPDQLIKEAASSENNGTRNANYLNEEWVDSVVPSAQDYDATICDKNHLLENGTTALIEVEGSETQAACHVQGDVADAKDNTMLEFDSGPAIDVHKSLESCSAKQHVCASETSDVEEEIGENNASQSSDVEDEIGENNAISQSSQVCRIDLLEEIIDEAKTSKRTLFSSMKSLINLMKEVELQEKAAELTNVEAATGGSDILARVEEYKTMLTHAKEANDMHAGEVYGEKAILATELRELQSRLLGLSEERDKSLAILDEMHQILQARLDAAEELTKAAEHEKQVKEESARKALAEQEAMMEQVVSESLRLQQEAEENSKLREFLMDRGQVVDVLQGEISVICQDIRLLKEKFDANLPLSKSFSSRETSCILASSGSSHKTSASDVGSVHSDSSQILKTSPAASVASLSFKSGHEDERPQADHKALIDDGWDIFEKDAELHY